MNMKVIQLAVGWLAQLIEHCTGIAKARKKKKGKKRKHCLHITILSLWIYLHSSNADRNNDNFLRLSVFLPCTDVIKCLTEYWTGDIKKRICRSLLKNGIDFPAADYTFNFNISTLTWSITEWRSYFTI